MLSLNTVLLSSPLILFQAKLLHPVEDFTAQGSPELPLPRSRSPCLLPPLYLTHSVFPSSCPPFTGEPLLHSPSPLIQALPITVVDHWTVTAKLHLSLAIITQVDQHHHELQVLTAKNNFCRNHREFPPAAAKGKGEGEGGLGMGIGKGKNEILKYGHFHVIKHLRWHLWLTYHVAVRQNDRREFENQMTKKKGVWIKWQNFTCLNWRIGGEKQNENRE